MRVIVRLREAQQRLAEFCVPAGGKDVDAPIQQVLLTGEKVDFVRGLFDGRNHGWRNGRRVGNSPSQQCVAPSARPLQILDNFRSYVGRSVRHWQCHDV